MRQLHDAYNDEAIVSALLAQLPRTHHLIILAQSRRPDERAFYIRKAIDKGWTSRELERQFRLGLLERSIEKPPFVSAALAQTQPRATEVFRDTYVLEFLDLPEPYAEAARVLPPERGAGG